MSRLTDEQLKRGRGTHKGTTNQDYSQDELDFLMSVDRYKAVNNVIFVPWSEVLWIIAQLGYKKGPNNDTCTVGVTNSDQGAGHSSD